MKIYGFVLWLAVLALAGCGVSEEAESGDDVAASVAQNEALVRQVLELIDARKLDAAFELYAEDYIYHGPSGQEIRGRDGIRGLWAVFLTGFPDLTSSVDEMITVGDKLVLRWTIEGTHSGEFLGVAASNRKMILPMTEIFRIADGQLAEAWDQYDRQHLMEQIGAIPLSAP